MRHQLLGVILSGLRRIGNKPGHQIQEVHKETWGKHRRKKLTTLEIQFITKPWPLSLSVCLEGNLSNSESLKCMLACDCGNVCMWVLTSMQEWAWMCECVLTCVTVFSFMCALWAYMYVLTHMCLHMCVVHLHACMYACAPFHKPLWLRMVSPLTHSPSPFGQVKKAKKPLLCA